MADGIERVREYDPLDIGVSIDICYDVLNSCKIQTYPVSHPHLEDGAILLRPPLRYFRMVRTKLVQASKKRQARDFWQSLNMWCISSIEQSIQEEPQDSNAGDVDGDSHFLDKTRGQ